jgi:hypothetical protein
VLSCRGWMRYVDYFLIKKIKIGDDKMKSKTFNKKLSLKKETIANLHIKQMGIVKAGKDIPPSETCLMGCVRTRVGTKCGSNPCC